MAVVYRYFFIYNRSLVYAADGIAQHYPALYFLNHWVRGVLYNPLAGIPLWSWSIGLGDDIISSLSFYVVGDPFTLISLAFPMTAMEYAFATMYAARALAAVLASMFLFRKVGARPLPALMGALIYTFTSFLLWAALHHPMFFNASVFLPLMLIGVENVLARKRSWTLTLFTGIAAAGNFYFFYMLSLVTGIYALARWLGMAEKDQRWRRLLPEAARFTGYYAAGLLLAAPILMPSMWAVLNTARSAEAYRVTLFYGDLWYRMMLGALSSSMVGIYATTEGTYLGFAYLGLVLMPVLFLRRKLHPVLTFMVVAFGLFAALPVFGWMFNGFSYPSDRFAFSWGVFIGAGVALLLSEQRAFDRREISAMWIGFAIYAALIAAFGRPITPTVSFPMVVGLLTLLVFTWESRAYARSAAPGALPGWTVEHRVPRFLPERWRSPATRWVVLGLLLANIVVNGTTMFDFRYSDVLEPYTAAHQVRSLYNRGPSKVIDVLPRTATRVSNAHVTDDRRTSRYYNLALVEQHMGTSFYLSVMNGALTTFNTELWNRTAWTSFSFDGFDDRVIPTTLLGTEFFTDLMGEGQFVPYGFEPFVRERDAIAYRNRNALPLGFVYTTAVSRSYYDRLDPIDKQSAMLQGVVVNDADATNLPRIKPTGESFDVTYTVNPSKGTTFDAQKRQIIRTEKKSNIELELERAPDTELYIQFEGISNVIQSPAERAAEILGPNPTEAEKQAFEYQVRDFHQPVRTWLTFNAHGGSKMIPIPNLETAVKRVKPSRLINMGYQRSAAETLTIDTPGIGTLSFDSLRVRAVPMAQFDERVATLKANAMTDIELGTNSVTGRVSPAEDGILFLSIPYTPGWSAKVDGEPVQTLRVNTAFTGVPVAAGEHEIELTYMTPWLVPGVIVSLGTAIAFVVVRILRRRRRLARAA